MSTDVQNERLLPTNRVWSLDDGHSFIGFSVDHHAFATFRARFGDVTGSYDAAAGTLSGSAAADSVETGEMLRSTLASEKFFDAEKYPTITFASTSVSAVGQQLTVEGELTLHGVTRPVTGTGTVTQTSRVEHYDGTICDHFGMNLEAAIDRSDFGIDFKQLLHDGNENLGWRVTMEFALEWYAPVE